MNDANREKSCRDIAIIGMSGRFPGASTLDQFWKNLKAGVESISFYSEADLLSAGVTPSEPANPNYIRAGSILEGIDMFDAPFFGFNAREAESIDPQIRFFMEDAWHALEDSGYDPGSYVGSIGVYAGCAMSTYLYELYRNPDFIGLVGYLQVLIGNDKDYLTTHTSYKLNLKGPSLSIQTTCSTSLVAVCLACQGLLGHECDMALAGGVCIKVPQKVGYYYERGGILSPDGHCRVFDAEAQGVVFGNGVGVVVLKRLTDALADGDSIHAIIKGSAINNDGSSKSSYTAPALSGQAAVISLAQAKAGISPDTITYVEAHGTGTPLGDPIEIAALTTAFRKHTERKQFCAVGSVKSNVGHLDQAAGITGLIKAVLSLKNKLLPPTLHVRKPNPEIDFANSPFYINCQLSEWKKTTSPRRAGVSAFGIGGTNAHVILEEAPAPEGNFTSARPKHLLLLSARSKHSLDTSRLNLLEHLIRNPSLNPADLAYTYQVGRRHFNHRMALLYQDLNDAMHSLEKRDSKRLLTTTQGPKQRSVAFTFPGQGTQYVNMALDLYHVEPTFRDRIADCSRLLKPALGLDINKLLYPTPEQEAEMAEKLRQTAVTQPALFAVEYSLAKLWMEWGIRPEAMIGHSIGEYVAACLAGVFSLEDALSLVAERGRLMQSMPVGSMLAVALPEEDFRSILDEHLSIAAVNEVRLCVASGSTDAVERLEAKLHALGVECRRLHTSHAFHSHMMEPMMDAFAKVIGRVRLNAPQLPFVSDVTGAWITAAEATKPSYWTNQLRFPVRFFEGLRLLLTDPDRIFVEVGPGQTLSAFVRRHPDKSAGHVVLSSLRHAQEQQADTEFLLNSLGRLWLSGAPINWKAFHAHERRGRIHLPVYPFERQRYWVAPPGSAIEQEEQVPIIKAPDIAEWFYVPSWQYAIKPEPSGNIVSDSTQPYWLIFQDDFGMGFRLRKHLIQKNHKVVTVRPGKELSKTGPDSYEINPRKRESYQDLMRELSTTGKLPTKIVHLWSVTPTAQRPRTADLFDEYQELGFYSLLYLSHALVRHNVIHPVQIAIVSNHMHLVTGEEDLCPAKATVLGACKCIPQEYPHITCRNFDVSLPAKWKAADDALLEDLIAEFTSSTAETVVAYRGGQRWVQVFESLPLDEPPNTIPMLRKGGVYLITGGLGNIGLALARNLAETVQANLALVRRSPFPRRKDWAEWLSKHDDLDPVSATIQRIREIEKLGSRVMVLNADVSDEAAMRMIVNDVYARFGSIHGIIHGAGNLAADGFFSIDQAEPDLCERQFQSKVRGLMVLEKLFRDEYLDFFVLLSSISSVLAGLGYVAYSAANIFMDAFACLQSQTSGVPWISINWDTWDFPSTSGAEAEPNPAKLQMFAEEGVDAFRRIMSWALLPQVVVSTGELNARIGEWVNVASLRERKEAEEEKLTRLHARPETANPYVAPRTKVEEIISALWRDALGISQVGVHDNFFADLSGSSLMATQLVAQLRSRFQIQFPLRRFFEAPTVADLAVAIEAIDKPESVGFEKPQSEDILGRDAPLLDPSLSRAPNDAMGV